MERKKFITWAKRVDAAINHLTRRFDSRWKWDENFLKGLSRCPNCGSVLRGTPDELLHNKPQYCWQCHTSSEPYDASSRLTRLIVHHLLAHPFPYDIGFPSLLGIGRVGRRVVDHHQQKRDL